MPYTSTTEVPSYVPAAKKKQWLEVFNSAYRRAKAGGKSDAAAEKSAFAQANAVAGPNAGAQLAQARGPAHSIERGTRAGQAPEWIEVMPAGKFVGRDGRGPYTNADPQAVIDETLKMDMPGGFVIDYDHASEFAAPEGREARAAAWMREFQVRDGAIWARVEWTDEGARHVTQKHWKYFSPVFDFKTVGGQRTVVRILNGALTNNPNLAMRPVAAARRTRMAASDVTIGDMEKAFVKAFPSFSRGQIIQLIEYACKLDEMTGDPEGAEEGALADARPEDDGAPTDPTVGEMDTDAEFHEGEDQMTRDEMTEEMVRECAAALHEGDGDPTEVEVDHARKVLAARQARNGAARTTTAQPRRATRASTADRQVMALTTQVNTMRNERAVEKATAAVDDAIKAKKLTPAQRAWGIDYATRDLRGFEAFAKNQPVLMEPSSVTRSTTTPTTAGVTGASAEVCSILGLKADKFAEHYEATKSNPASGAAMMSRNAA